MTSIRPLEGEYTDLEMVGVGHLDASNPVVMWSLM